MLPIVEEVRGYDFMDPQNADKWRGLFIIPLKKVLEQVHPTLGAEDSALEYVESLCLRLLAMLCAAPPPTTVLDVEERVSRVFPSPLARWALSDARDASSSRRRRPLLLPADRIHAHLNKAKVLPPKTDVAVSTFMTSIVEYVSADVLKLAGNFKKIAQNSFYETITCTDIKTAMCADKVLMDMFHAESELAGVGAGCMPGVGACAGLGAGGGAGGAGARRHSLTYAELVRDLLADLHHFLKELNLIIRVFKDDIEKIVADVDDKLCPQIFGNIVDIYELTVTLLGNVEDAIEMAEDSPTPFIGSCFEELAEVEEFRAYVRYANTVTSPDCRDAINTIADDPELGERLEAANQGFRLAVKLYLPRLLLAPVSHVFAYHSYVLSLMHVSSATDDREHFKQVDCNLSPIKKLLIKAVGNQTKIEPSYRAAARARRQLAIDKCSELAKLVDSWEQREIAQCCNEFYREDVFIKLGPGRRTAERRVYMFDGVLVLCKPVMPIVSLVMAHPNSTNSASGTQLKLKERLHMRKMVIYDRPDTEEARNIVELVPASGAPVLLSCASRADKLHWLSDAVMLNTRPTLERCLDSLLLELERRHPLQLPPTSLYRFAEPDGPHNLVLDHTNPAPLIKGATLLKLVERLTYHIYADLNLVRTFLTTYRSFCSPHELLDLLVERFNIPEPSEVYDAPRPGESIDSVASDAEKLSMNTVREDWKRYRKEFQQPVKFRVINVIRHWVDGHFYDFERDEELLEKLRSFLNAVDGKPMRKWVKSVLKTIQRKSGQMGEAESVSHVFSSLPPAPLRHPADPARHHWHPLALHPLELARQLTLLEFQLYRLVRPSELVGAVWTKRDKERSSPNLLKLIKHTTNFTRWMEKWIVESENIEERAGVVCRLLELAGALRDLNNFNGVLAVVAAAGSAAVHRLRATFQLVPPRLLRALEEFRELNSDHFRRYQERLRSINPPCVPFFGMYLTNILHIEEGNLDYLPNSELINFSKRRKVAEITGEIQQYQNQPYCLTVEPKTRAFLEGLDPFPGMDDNEITNYLYAKSLEIEPRPPAKQIPKFPRKYPELSLKPMKISRRHHDQPAPDDINCNQLSPTSAWDGGSVSSLSIDDKPERVPLSSPRSERASLAQLSLLDKGLALFDKTKSGTLSSLSSHGSTASMVSSAGITNTGIGTCGTGSGPSPGTNNTKPALSPRGAIVDAELFYSRNTSHRREQSQERVPPLLPRNSAVSASTISVNSIQVNSDEEPPPVLPRRPSSPHHPPDIPPEPPERPLPSPKHLDFYRMSGMSPKRSPAPQPPASPLTAHDTRVNLFRFPAAGSPSPPAHPHPPPPLTPYSGHSGHSASTASSSSTPPPLPPRRRRDSAVLPAHSPAAASCVSGPSVTSGPSGPPPPPLPPRPAPAPPLLRPAHSTILQRRHHTHNSSTGAPRLPPKPPPAAVAPRT